MPETKPSTPPAMASGSSDQDSGTDTDSSSDTEEFIAPAKDSACISMELSGEVREYSVCPLIRDVLFCIVSVYVLIMYHIIILHHNTRICVRLVSSRSLGVSCSISVVYSISNHRHMLGLSIKVI